MIRTRLAPVLPGIARSLKAKHAYGLLAAEPTDFIQSSEKLDKLTIQNSPERLKTSEEKKAVVGYLRHNLNKLKSLIGLREAGGPWSVYPLEREVVAIKRTKAGALAVKIDEGGNILKTRTYLRIERYPRPQQVFLPSTIEPKCSAQENHEILRQLERKLGHPHAQFQKSEASDIVVASVESGEPEGEILEEFLK